MPLSGTDPPAHEHEPRGWPTWTVVAIFWLATSLLYAAQVVVMSSMPGERFSVRTLLIWQVPFWVLWAPLAPIVLWIGARFPLDGRRWTRSVPVHLVALLVLAGAHAAAAAGIGQLFAPTVREAYLTAARGFFLSRVHFELLVYAATLGVAYGLDYRRRLRERELSASRLEAQLANARLEALRMQLNPHFLFNTLHTVAALVRGQRNDEAVTMIAGLSELLRRTLDQQATQQTSLGDELTFVERYLDIQRVRFGDRLQVVVHVDPAARAALVPTLILQPLVENALRHGLAPRAASGVVTIGAARHDGHLRLEVSDNGVGWKGSAGSAGSASADANGSDPDALDPARGVGLANTRSRLRHLYGDNGTLELGDVPGGGARVRVELPWRDATPAPGAES